MNKTKFVGGLVVAAIAVAAVAQTVSGPELIKSFAASLNKAESLKSTFTVLNSEGAMEKYEISLSKPDLARIDKSGRLIVADGTNIVFYDKATKVYYKRAQSATELAALFTDPELKLFGPFFDADAFKGFTGAKSNGVKTRKGVALNVVDVTTNATVGLSATLLLNPSDNIARQAELKQSDNDKQSVRLWDVKNLALGPREDASAYAFKAPSDAREMSEAEMSADRWFENMDDAIAAAKATNRRILIDFYTVWCQWCKVLDKEVYPAPEFKKMSKYFVFLRLDAERGGMALAKQMGVNAYPTIKFTLSDGKTIVYSIVGYKPLPEFLKEMEQAKG